MGGGLASAPLAGAVAKAGGLGTLGLALPRQLRTSIDQVRAAAPGRAVTVNLLMPFVHRSHVRVCVDARADAVVVAFGGDREIIEHLLDAVAKHTGAFGMVGSAFFDVDGLGFRGSDDSPPTMTHRLGICRSGTVLGGRLTGGHELINEM
jgi:hypothetical protein